MGTSHQQKVITKDGVLKISQYGQWDGYPSGQGLDILKFLKKSNLKKYQKELEKIRLINQEDTRIVAKSKNPKDEYYHLHRDCGADIHKLIEDGKVEFVGHIDDEEAKKWCFGFYTINFQDNTFTSIFGDNKTVYDLDDLPSKKKYLKKMKDKQ